MYLDIERTYGQRKLLAKRTPLQPLTKKSITEKSRADEHVRSASISSTASFDLSTPSATEGESGTETDEPHTDSDSETENEAGKPHVSKKRRQFSDASSAFGGTPNGVERTKSLTSQHDLFNRYFRKDAVLLHNIDLLRSVFSSSFLSIFVTRISCSRMCTGPRIFSSCLSSCMFCWRRFCQQCHMALR